MHPQLRQIPPSNSRSTIAVLSPSWAARIAATYPPGPEPRTMRSYVSGIMRSVQPLFPRGRGVGERGLQSIQDAREHALFIVENVTVPNAQDTKALCL